MEFMEFGFALTCEGWMSLSDDECIRACLNDHPEAFRHLVQRYQTPLARYLRGRLGNTDEAAEAAQEAFVRAYFALGELRKPAAFLSWLLGIADRVAKETQRAARRCLTVDWEQIEPAEPAGKRETEAEAAMSEAVARLPDTYREVIVLRYHGGYSCAEIGRDLGIPLGSVTKRLSRAYALLRENLRGKLANPENELEKKVPR
jgi:RNA polymerase sigma-70 factor (ECF subfamily)